MMNEAAFPILKRGLLNEGQFLEHYQRPEQTELTAGRFCTCVPGFLMQNIRQHS